MTPNISSQAPVSPPKKIPKRNYDWKEIRKLLTLKNFTIVSIVFMLIGLLPQINSQNNFISSLQGFFEIGIICFILAYFLYAVKCWGENDQGYAFFMVMIPLLVNFLATSKITEPTTNILFYLFIQFCFYGILAVILLYISDKVKMGIERYLFRRTRRSHWYFIPKSSYVLFGIVFVSLLVLNFGSISLLSDNSNMISQSLQKINSPAYATSASNVVPTPAASQNSQIVPTLQPDIINRIESTVSNSAPVIDIPTLENKIHEGINQQRKNNGLSSLSYDSALASIARKHSADMALNNYFEHVNLQGLDPTDRGNKAGYSCNKNYGSYYTTGIAENIMQNNLYDSVTTTNGIPRYDWNSQEEIAQSTVEGWMNSPGHRKNILTSTYDREGIGVSIATDKKVYITQDFC
ncbi:MAG: CAP domain-containing protein [Methanoregula sp.]|nr:CAP domain-containing protein [Methanoregula sp.]